MIRLTLLAATVLFAGCATPPPETSSAPAVAGADTPDTEIFVGSVNWTDGAPAISALSNATAHEGYDNQPSFLAGEAAFYYVAESESGKTDIRLYDIARGASQPVFTSAGQSEYSPKEAPAGGVSYIQENPAGDVTRVYLLAPGEKEGAPVAEFAPLGYYAWLDGGAALGVYYRTDPGSLYRVDIESGDTALLHERIARTMQSDPAGRSLWFSEIPEGGASILRIMRYDVKSGAIEPLFALPDDATEFFAVLNDDGAADGFFSASGSTLYWRRTDADDWSRAADLSPSGVFGASRIALSSDRKHIAIVGEIGN